jgi:peptide-methionine (S)-S-oxide reductase
MFNKGLGRRCLVIFCILLLSQLTVACSGQPQLFSSSIPNASSSLVRGLKLEAPLDLPVTVTQGTQTLVLAGGCFWGVEGVFEKLKGVSNVISGFTGGTADTANYDAVSNGKTSHAEAVQITYDPQQISLGQLLKIYFLIAHDPTEIDRQGPDTGKQYRSAIFFANSDQQKVATAYIDKLNQAKIFPRPIATQLESFSKFYAAEEYHQNFIDRNPNYPYVVINDLPKIAQLRQHFPDLVKSKS